METRTVRLEIIGRVQGVGYRDWTVREARRLALTGWVRNRPDGSVEVVASGPAPVLDTFITACRTGPRHAVVADILITDTSTPDLPHPFERRPTG